MYILLPLLSGFLTSAVCPMTKELSKPTPQSPPSWVFGIIWPILYLLIGLAWSKSKSKLENKLFWLLNILLCFWLVMWSCKNNKKGALYIIFAALTCAIALVKQSPNGILLVPLVGWLLYASRLNWQLIS